MFRPLQKWRLTVKYWKSNTYMGLNKCCSNKNLLDHLERKKATLLQSSTK